MLFWCHKASGFTSFRLCHCCANPFDTNKWYVQYCRHKRDLIEWYFWTLNPLRSWKRVFHLKIEILMVKKPFSWFQGVLCPKYHSIRSLSCLQYWTYHLFVSKGLAQQWHRLKLVNHDCCHSAVATLKKVATGLCRVKKKLREQNFFWGFSLYVNTNPKTPVAYKIKSCHSAPTTLLR